MRVFKCKCKAFHSAHTPLQDFNYHVGILSPGPGNRVHDFVKHYAKCGAGVSLGRAPRTAGSEHRLSLRVALHTTRVKSGVSEGPGLNR